MKTATLVNDVLAVLNDGSRIDRYLTRAADGSLYLTTHNTAEQQVCVACDDGSVELSEEEEISNAEEIIGVAEMELD